MLLAVPVPWLANLLSPSNMFTYMTQLREWLAIFSNAWYFEQAEPSLWLSTSITAATRGGS